MKSDKHTNRGTQPGDVQARVRLGYPRLRGPRAVGHWVDPWVLYATRAQHGRVRRPGPAHNRARAQQRGRRARGAAARRSEVGQGPCQGQETAPAPLSPPVSLQTQELEASVAPPRGADGALIRAIGNALHAEVVRLPRGIPGAGQHGASGARLVALIEMLRGSAFRTDLGSFLDAVPVDPAVAEARLQASHEREPTVAAMPLSDHGWQGPLMRSIGDNIDRVVERIPGGIPGTNPIV